MQQLDVRTPCVQGPQLFFLMFKIKLENQQIPRYSKVQLGLHHWCVASAEPGSQLSQLGPSWVLRDLHGSEVTSSRGGKEQLFIVDQHASDEKFRFEAQPEID